MRNIRIFFSKRDRAKYISHLDMTRLFQRAVRRTGITMWYTEGFHPHLYMTFALPLSLGQESLREMMNFKVEPDMTPEEAAKIETILQRTGQSFQEWSIGEILKAIKEKEQSNG